MKFSTIAFIPIFLSILMVGCDPTHNIDFQVMNNTEESIKLVVDYFGTPSDTNVISSGTTLLFFNDFGIGATGTEYLDNLENLPVGLSIFDQAGHSYNKIEEDISNWQKFYPDKKLDGRGSVELTVRPVDFE